MPNETTQSAFPASQQDISNLKQTATDAVSDISNSASDHASKAKSQLRDLAGNFQREGQDQFERVKGSLNEVFESARDYAADRPFVCIGAALAIGYLFGLSHRGHSSDQS